MKLETKNYVDEKLNFRSCNLSQGLNNIFKDYT